MDRFEKKKLSTATPIVDYRSSKLAILKSYEC